MYLILDRVKNCHALHIWQLHKFSLYLLFEFHALMLKTGQLICRVGQDILTLVIYDAYLKSRRIRQRINDTILVNQNKDGISRYRTIFLKRLIQGLVFKGILKGQESKSWIRFEGPRRFRGPQKSEKFNFLNA